MNATRQVVRHFNRKHSHFLQHLVSHHKLKLSTAALERANASVHIADQPLETTSNNCFSTNQVLFIIAVTCFLNFAFIVLIMTCVQILASTTSDKENSDEDTLLKENRDEALAESGRLSSWQCSRIRLAGFADHMLAENVVDKIAWPKKATATSKCGRASCGQNDEPCAATAATYDLCGRRAAFCDDHSQEDGDCCADCADCADHFHVSSDEYDDHDRQSTRSIFRPHFQRNKLLFSKYRA